MPSLYVVLIQWRTRLQLKNGEHHQHAHKGEQAHRDEAPDDNHDEPGSPSHLRDSHPHPDQHHQKHNDDKHFLFLLNSSFKKGSVGGVETLSVTILPLSTEPKLNYFCNKRMTP